LVFLATWVAGTLKYAMFTSVHGVLAVSRANRLWRWVKRICGMARGAVGRRMATALAMSEIPEAERVFLRIFVATGDREAASAISGIPPSTILRNSHSQRAMHAELNARLLMVAPIAVRVLESLMTDPDVPAAVRRLAASDLLDRVGLVSQASMALSKPIESLSEMPARDLRQLVERLETELFSRAKPVRDLQFETPNVPPEDAKPLSVLD
jgi:hypothetical protein